MQIKITFRSMDHSDAIEKYVRAEIEKFGQLFNREGGPINISVVLEAHREKHYFIAEFIVDSSDYHAVTRAEGADMYTMINDAAHKMTQELIKQKGKLLEKQDHRHGR